MAAQEPRSALKPLGRISSFALVALILIVFSASLVISFQRSVRLEDRLSGELAHAIWTISQIETELLNFRLALSDYEQRGGDAAHARLLERFDVFWSRLPINLESRHLRPLHRREDLDAAIEDTLLTLEELEPRVIALRPGDAAGFAAIRAKLEPMAKRLHKTTVEAYMRSTQGSDYRDVQLEAARRELVIAILGLLVSGSALIVLLLREVGRTRSLLKTAQEAKQALRDSQERLIDAIESISDGFILYDRDRRLILHNRKYAELYPEIADDLKPGQSLEAIVQRSVETGSVLNRSKDPATLVAQRLAQVERGEGHVEQHLKDGRWVIARERRTREGGFVGVRSDITRLKAAEAHILAAKDAAEQANRAKSDFLANMSHELRTPLNAVIGFAQVIGKESLGRIENRQYLEFSEEIANAGQHLLSLINDLLDLSKIEAGRFNLNEQLVELPAVVDTSLSLVRRQAEEGGIELRRIVEDGLPPLLADERLMTQILVNLLSNAVKFTPEGGSVTVEVGCDALGGLVLKVIDTGIGMTAEHIATAMTRFGQVDSRLNRPHGGTGLGLPLTQSFIEMHGGSLVLTSEIGAGTTATATFPPERCETAENAAAGRVPA